MPYWVNVRRVSPTLPNIRVSPRTLRRHADRVFADLVAVGDLVSVECGQHRFLVANTAEHVRELMLERSEQLVKHSQLIEAGGRPAWLPVYGGGISVPLFRAALARGLTPARIPETLAAVSEAASTETEGWRDGLSLPLMAMTRRVATRAVCRSSFASSLTSTELASAQRAIAWADLQSRITSRSTRNLERLKLYTVKRKAAAARLTALGASLIDNADRAQQTQLTAVVDELPTFHPSAGRQQQNAIVGELFQGAAAPLAQTASWLLLRFAQHEEVAERLRAEWQRVLHPGAPVDRDCLKALVYTSAFIREVTRFHPTNARIVRAAVADTELGGVPVPVGTRVVVNVRAIHNDPRFYSGPAEFKPDRWLDSRPAASTLAYLAFGVGTRRCLGENMAMVALAAMLPALARNWDFAHGQVAVVDIGRNQPAERTRVELRSR